MKTYVIKIALINGTENIVEVNAENENEALANLPRPRGLITATIIGEVN